MKVAAHYDRLSVGNPMEESGVRTQHGVEYGYLRCSNGYLLVLKLGVLLNLPPLFDLPFELGKEQRLLLCQPGG